MGGWTRIDMLLAIYDKAIAAIQAVQEAQLAGDKSVYAARITEAQKCILAIHSGLKPDEDDVAYNIARLLNFILRRLEEENYPEAIRFLGELRTSFSKIYEDAISMEKRGLVPPIHTPNSVSSLV